MAKVPDTRPAILKWFHCYCFLVFILTGLFLIGYAIGVGAVENLGHQSNDRYLLLETNLLSVAIYFSAGLFLSGCLIKPNPSGWKMGLYHLVVTGSLMFACFLYLLFNTTTILFVAALALIFFPFLLTFPLLLLYLLFKPETKAEFGISPPADTGA